VAVADPGELLDVYDEREEGLGVERRDVVHRDGLWHRCFHLWVLSGDGVLLQRRAADKEAFPGMLDATAAGHLLAGESVADGAREAEEELGVAFALTALAPLGMRPMVDRPTPETINREFQHVFLARDPRPLTAWTRLDRAEVAGLAWVGLGHFGELVRGAAPGPWPAREWDGRTVAATRIAREEVVPAGYGPTLAVALEHVARGRPTPGI
jgi:isopentenyldiphosphate isomerase